MDREAKRVQMMDVVHEFHLSGQSQISFARDNDIKLATLRYWLKKDLEERSSDFIPLAFKHSQDNMSHLTVRYPNGVELSISGQVPSSYLRDLIML